MAPALGIFVLWDVRARMLGLIGRLKTRSSPPSCFGEFRSNGAVGAKVGSNVRARIAKCLEPYTAQLRARLEKLPPESMSYEDAQFVLKRAEAPEIYATIGDMLEEQGVFDLVRTYLPGALGQIKAITLQWNRAGETHWRNKFPDMPAVRSTSDYLHVDTGSNLIKAIYYVSDKVSAENGAFSYVIGSNNRAASLADRIIRSAADHSGLSRTNPEMRRLFNALPKFLQRKADFGFDIVDDAADALKRDEKIFTTEDGHLVVFDNFGAHRGGMVREGQRVILQVVLW